MNSKPNIPLLSYFQRYWYLLVIIGLLVALYASGTLGVTTRALLIVPIFLSIAVAAALLVRSALHRHTTDALVNDRERFRHCWNQVPDSEKAKITKVEHLVYVCCATFIAGCLLLLLPALGAGVPVDANPPHEPRPEEVTLRGELLVPVGSRRPDLPKAVVPPERKMTPRERWWQAIETAPASAFRVDKALALYGQTRGRYERVTAMRRNGVPAPVVFVLHMRESTWSFARHLHEGSSLRGRTRWVPKGRPRQGNPPFTWEESAEDALYTLKDLESKRWVTVEDWMDKIEKYNGLGYRRYHKDVPSPYLVAGSNLQKPGKYVADGRFSRTAVDRQLGCMTVLKEMETEGLMRPLPYDDL